MTKIAAAAAALFLASIVAPSVHAQSLEARLQKFADDFAKGYTKPVTDAFGASLNSGWYHSANVDDGLDLFVGVKVMLMPIPSDAKTFKINSVWPPNTEQEVPTFFGSSTEVDILNAPPTVSPTKYPGGVDFGFGFLAVPHISAGNIFGTRAIIRFLPKVKLGDLGETEFFGIGVQHSVSRYIPLVPIDISVLAAYQSLSVGSLISTKAYTFGAQASKSFVLVTIYGGLAYESSKMSFSYTATFTDPSNPSNTITRPIGFDTNGKNNFRVTAGLALSLGLIKLNVDYSLASQPVATAGIGVGW